MSDFRQTQWLERAILDFSDDQLNTFVAVVDG